MRTAVFTVLLLLSALTAAAGKIESIDPPSVPVGSGEQFIAISGTELGDHVLFAGKAGQFELEISARSERGVVAYVPEDVVNTPGRYEIYVRGDFGIGGPAFFDVFDPQPQGLVLLVPDPITAPATSRSGAVVQYEVWPYGGSDPRPVVNCSIPSGSMFPMGPTNVECVATSSTGERASGQVSVTVYDGGNPIVKVPDRIRAIAESAQGVIVKFDVSAYDEIDGELKASCTPESGSLFPIGTTVVDCVAMDAAFNIGTGSFEVVVENRGFLLLHTPSQVVAEAESGAGAVVKFEVWADGTDDPNPEVKCEPESGSQFPVGATMVKCVATDRFGNKAEGSFEVNVTDTAPPMFARLYAKPNALNQTNELVPVTLVWEVVDVVDPQPRCAVANVWSDQEITADDWKFISESEVALRASTDGVNDRIYHVNVVCTDASGNAGGADADVRVIAGKQQSISQPATPAPTKRRSSRH